ncbi:MAG: HEPN domain-containing protein [Nitrospinae bacterium]|nr:HEPN domain-containing protein [Nitrospinota bacterium]
MKKEAKILLQVAQRDYVAFDILRRNPDAHLNNVLFNAQQCAEKLIKAALAFNEVYYKKTHNLIELYYQLEEKDIPFPASMDDLEKLNPYAVGFRYESSEIGLMSREEAAELLNILREWAKQIVGE